MVVEVKNQKPEELSESLSDKFLELPLGDNIYVLPKHEKMGEISTICLNGAVSCAIKKKVVSYQEDCRSCPERGTETKNYIVCF